MLESEGGLDQTRNSGPCLQMADIGLHRPYDAVAACRPAGGEHLADGCRFDRITYLRSGPVRLDVLDRGSRNACLAQRLP